MANPNPTAITAAFPAPPPFYKSFTPQNLDRLHDLLEPSDPDDSNPQQQTSETSQKPLHDLTSLSPELRHLIPPPPPPEGRYRSFGELHSVNLPNPSNPPQFEVSHLNPPPPASTSTTTTTASPSPHTLLHLTRQILLTFLALIDRLATTPADYGPKWDVLKTLFLEAHAVINEYRPHQARETLIMMMEEQVERGRDEGRRGREGGERVRAVLGEVAKLEGVAGVEGGEDGEGKRGEEVDEDRRLWEILNSDVGEGW